MDDKLLDELVPILQGCIRIVDVLLLEDPESISPVCDAPTTFAFLTDVARFYEQAQPRQRAVLHSILPSQIHRILVWHYIPHLVHRFSETPDRELLRLALLAISLDNKGWDCRDTLMALGSLYRAAVSAHIDPMVDFRDVAAISSTQGSFGSTGEEAEWSDDFPMRAFLERFEESAHFQVDVKPSLSAP
jgi:hypothetical protein